MLVHRDVRKVCSGRPSEWGRGNGEDVARGVHLTLVIYVIIPAFPPSGNLQLNGRISVVSKEKIYNNASLTSRFYY